MPDDPPVTAQGRPGDAAKRWQQLVHDRLAELARLIPGGGARGADYWGSERSRRFADQVLGTGDRDPVFARVRRAVDSASVVVDVGSGVGRLALPLAQVTSEVVAVDASAPMLEILASEAARLGVSTIRSVHGSWPDVDVPRADVVVCAFVLALVEDAASFLRALDAAATRRVFLCPGGDGGGLPFDALWRHFHGGPRRPGPTYLDAVAVLRELGIEPEVEAVAVPSLVRYTDLAQAVDGYRDQLRLPDTAEIQAELTALLGPWLVRRDGALRPVVTIGVTPLLTWVPTTA